MEVSLPISAAVKAQASRPVTVAPALGRHTPSVKLPLAFVLTGLLALLVTVGWLVARPEMLATYHYNQSVIAATHLFVLGWLGTVVMGALYQLVPVALETKLYSSRLAAAHLVLHVVGLTGMVWMFKGWKMEQVGHFGSVLLLGVLLFLYNLVRTLLRVPKWSLTATGVTAALGWLLLGVTAGLTVAAGKCFYETADEPVPAGPLGWLVMGLKYFGARATHFDAISAMHAHAHLGAIGFFLMLIVAVSYKLVPMFTLGEIQSPRRAAASLLLLNLGLAGAFLGILLRSPWKLAFALVSVAALGLYTFELRAILEARKRRTLDWGLRSFFTALLLLVPLSVLSAVLCWPGLPVTAFTGQLENLYGFLGLVGVISFAIIGMLYKIVPFLVWFGTYSKKIGLAQVPALADLYSHPLQIAGYFAFLAALAATSAGILAANNAGVRCGCLLLALSLSALTANVGIMLTHCFHPKLKPLASRAAAASTRA